MMKKSHIAFLFICLSIGVKAQNVMVDRQVIGSGGAIYTQGTNAISATVGETVIFTSTGNNATLTQGFQQPAAKAFISFSVNSTNESCVGAGNGSASVQQISGCSPPYQILWSNGSTGSAVSGLTAGVYSVQVSSATCQSEQAVSIGLEEDIDCQLTIYTGITPNGDGDNDYWHIENIEFDRYQNNKVSIYNRWGDAVWTGNNYNNQSVRWNGEGKKERELPDGTYFYVIEFDDTTFKGSVELTR